MKFDEETLTKKKKREQNNNFEMSNSCCDCFRLQALFNGENL